MLKIRIRMGTSYSGCPAEEREFEYDGTAEEFDNDDAFSTEILNMLLCGDLSPYYLDISTEEVSDEEDEEYETD